MGTAARILNDLQYLSKIDLIYVRDKCNDLILTGDYDENNNLQLDIDPIGEALNEEEDETLPEWVKQIDKDIIIPEMIKQANNMTEAELNSLFQQDHKDQNDEVDKDINERLDYYKSDRPMDP